MGTRSLSWKLTPYAPADPSISAIWTGEIRSRVGSPNGSRPGLPTVQRPKVNFILGSGAKSLGMEGPLEFQLPNADFRLPRESGVGSFLEDLGGIKNVPRDSW